MSIQPDLIWFGVDAAGGLHGPFSDLMQVAKYDREKERLHGAFLANNGSPLPAGYLATMSIATVLGKVVDANKT